MVSTGFTSQVFRTRRAIKVSSTLLGTIVAADSQEYRRW